MSESDPLETAWVALRERWDDEQAHAAFVALATSMDRLADAAGRYREAETDPAFAAGAARGKQLVLAHAMAKLDTTPRQDLDAAKRRGRVVLPVAFLLLLFGVSVMMGAVTHKHVFVSLPVLALEILFVALLPWGRLLR